MQIKDQIDGYYHNCQRISLNPVNLNAPEIPIEQKSSAYRLTHGHLQTMSTNIMKNKRQKQNNISSQVGHTNNQITFLRRKKGRLTFKQKQLRDKFHISCYTNRLSVNPIFKKRINRKRTLPQEKHDFSIGFFQTIKNENTQEVILQKNHKYSQDIINNIPVLAIDYEDNNSSDYEQKISNTDLMNSKFDQLLQYSQLYRSESIESVLSTIVINQNNEAQDVENSQSSIAHKAQSHQQILEEENTYIRQHLLQLLKTIEHNKSIYQQSVTKNQILYKENDALKRQIQRLNLIKQTFQEQLISNQQHYYDISNQTIDQREKINDLKNNKQQLQSNIQYLSNEYQQLFETFAAYQNVKEKQIEQIISQNNNETQVLMDQISEKQHIINQLTQSINSLKDTINLIQQQKQNAINQILIGSTQDFFENLFSENVDNASHNINLSKSICLPLAQAEQLKNIIEEKERQLINLKIQFSNQSKKYCLQIVQLKQKNQIYQKNIVNLSDKECQYKQILKNALRMFQMEKLSLQDEEILFEQLQEAEKILFQNHLQKERSNEQTIFQKQQEQTEYNQPFLLYYQSIDELQDEELQDFQQNM